MMAAASLDQLQDIQLPTAVSWWPPAPGWWLLGLLVLALAATALVLLRRRQRLRYRHAANKLLTACWRDYLEHRDDGMLLRELLALVRRVLRETTVSTPKHTSAVDGAALPTSALLTYLDDRTGGALAGVLPLPKLAERLYQPAAEPMTETQARDLYQAIQRWLRHPGTPPC